jgi:hypothetical protein
MSGGTAARWERTGATELGYRNSKIRERPTMIGVAPAGGTRLNRQSTGRRKGMEILPIAIGIIAVVWLIVLWGSRYLGPQ